MLEIQVDLIKTPIETEVVYIESLISIIINSNHGANLTVKSILLRIYTNIFMAILKFAFHAHL